jgi:two-component system CheB/CheR fusion protein
MPIGPGDPKELYLKIFEDFPALIWRSGLDMKCDYFNRTWLEFTGRTFEQENGDGWAEGVHPDDLAACIDTYVGSFGRREPFTMHYRLRRRDGEFRWIRDMGRPFYDLDDAFLGYIGSCYDVTDERENAIRLEDLNRAKDRFFSVVAHDLSGPMGAIETMTDILEKDYRGFSPEELATAMAGLHNAARGAVGLLGDLLEWSRAQLERGAYAPERLDAAALAAAAAAPLEAVARAKGVAISVEAESGAVLLADPHLARAVLRNLASNAVKFSRPGGTVRIAAAAKGARCEIRVRDDGVGLDEAALAGLFRPGGAASLAGTAGERGHGLGLVICKEFVERCGGSIRAESRPGAGAEFIVELPTC